MFKIYFDLLHHQLAALKVCISLTVRVYSSVESLLSKISMCPVLSHPSWVFSKILELAVFFNKKIICTPITACLCYDICTWSYSHKKGKSLITSNTTFLGFFMMSLRLSLCVISIKLATAALDPFLYFILRAVIIIWNSILLYIVLSSVVGLELSLASLSFLIFTIFLGALNSLNCFFIPSTMWPYFYL